MMCPCCGEEATLRSCNASWTEPHGEYCCEEWTECSKCGARFGASELERIAAGEAEEAA